ncbi:TonB-dependent receptor [Phocaeicola sp.]|uniref:TonB-dependent receptor n=1 Tax=Phocaeicola sp. TaxID=2773926 RepID=UPI003AB2BA2D
MKHISAIIMGVALLPVVKGYAQEQAKDSTLNRTVVVENQYNPEVMDAFKVNVLPKVEEPAVAKQHIDYATSVRPLTTWNFSPMAPITSEQKQPDAPRGYIRGAYGSRNNADLKASYLWDISRRDRLQFMGSLYGMYGSISSLLPEEGDWKSRFYRTDVALDYKHDFQKVSLTLGGAFTSQVFNYMPGKAKEIQNMYETTRQHYTLGEGYVGVSSVEGQLPVEFSIQTGLRSFSRKYDIPYMRHGSENIFHTVGFIAGALNEEQRVGIALGMDNLIHDVEQTDYTLLKLNPYYTLENDDVRLRVGAHVDWQSANGSGIKAAPDVKVDYTFSDTYVVYLHATGGTQLNDFRQLNEISPYWGQISQMRTSYTPADIQAGFKASPIPGLGFQLFGGYRVTKDEIFLIPGALEEHFPYCYSLLLQEKVKVGYGGAKVAYGYKDIFDFSVNGTYYGWNVKDEAEALLYLKPQFVLEASARAKVYNEFWISADYRYEGRVKVSNLERADAMNNLSLSAGYEFFNCLNVFARFDNVLNRDYITQSGYLSQGFNALAGISFRF